MGITVIIPFYDEFIFIEQAVVSALRCRPVERVIIGNDGFNDAARAFIDELAARWPQVEAMHNARNLGAAATRNAAIERVRSSHVLFLDSDDLLIPAGVESAWALATASGGDMTHLPFLRFTPEHGNLHLAERDHALFARETGPGSIDEYPQFRFATGAGSFLYRRELFEAADLRFDETQRKFEDHLLILRATQAAQDIAGCGSACRVWRNRGNSLSTDASAMSDYAMQVGSFEKSIDFLTRFYPVNSPAVQRDACFTFMRFLTGWTFLAGCHAARGRDPRADELLTRLARACRRVPLDSAIGHDPLIRRTFGRHPRSIGGKKFAIERIPSIHAMVGAWDWEAVLAEIGVVPGEQTACAGQPAGISPSTDLSSLLWQAYRSRLQEPRANEQRLFSEFVLDRLGLVLSAADRRTIADWPSPDNVRSILQTAAVRRHRAPHVWQCGSAQEVRSACGHARHLTSAFAQGSPDVTKATVAAAWRTVEHIALKEGLNEVFEGDLSKAEAARSSGANWRSRIKEWLKLARDES